ncbi:MAG: hypothetical protein C5B49_13785 [Bdellovibrio sp.]|nr:MAG: hypothetical protein C5B49_13785 [Bdellovibrio sp.]
MNMNLNNNMKSIVNFNVKSNVNGGVRRGLVAALIAGQLVAIANLARAEERKREEKIEEKRIEEKRIDQKLLAGTWKADRWISCNGEGTPFQDKESWKGLDWTMKFTDRQVTGIMTGPNYSDGKSPRQIQCDFEDTGGYVINGDQLTLLPQKSRLVNSPSNPTTDEQRADKEFCEKELPRRESTESDVLKVSQLDDKKMVIEFEEATCETPDNPVKLEFKRVP